MKIYSAFFTILLTWCFTVSKAQSGRVVDEPIVRKDSLFIDSLSKIIKSNPLEMEKFRTKFWYVDGYPPKLAEEIDNLGFDYKSAGGYEPLATGGRSNLIILYRMVYFKDKLIGFRLRPIIPNDKILTNRYLKIYSHLFKVNDSLPEPLDYNTNVLSEPLLGYPDNPPVINDEIKTFMTPFYGVMYLMYGGNPNHLFPERLYFEKLKKYLTPEICELLMYSKNAATRLYAIEYYYKNKGLFNQNKTRIESRISVVFKEVPEIRTIHSDVVTHDNAKDLVERLSREEP